MNCQLSLSVSSASKEFGVGYLENFAGLNEMIKDLDFTSPKICGDISFNLKTEGCTAALSGTSRLRLANPTYVHATNNI